MVWSIHGIEIGFKDSSKFQVDQTSKPDLQSKPTNIAESNQESKYTFALITRHVPAHAPYHDWPRRKDCQIPNKKS